MRPRPSPPTVGLTRVIPFDVRRSGSDESPTRHRSRPLGRVDHGERAFGVPSTSSSSSSLPASSAGLTAIAGGAKQRFRVVVRRNPLGRGGVVGQRNWATTVLPMVISPCRSHDSPGSPRRPGSFAGMHSPDRPLPPADRRTGRHTSISRRRRSSATAVGAMDILVR